uniref:Ion transport domain-containing protein n=1 Tax=Romanomermis culicivorax TaxID=13658 RepID=A0A915HJT1_ROMCU
MAEYSTKSGVSGHSGSCTTNTICMVNSSLFYPMTDEDRKCLMDRQYWCFLLSSLVTLCVCMSLVVIWRAVVYVCCQLNSVTPGKGPKSDGNLNNYAFTNGKEVDGQAAVAPQEQQYQFGDSDEMTHIGWVTEAKDWAGELISGQTPTGRILVVLVFVLSIASLVIYFYDASHAGFQVETCHKWTESTSQQIDLAFNIFFLIYFFIRFIAAPDKVWFLLEVYSFIDYLTIPPSFVAIYLKRNWLGKKLANLCRVSQKKATNTDLYSFQTGEAFLMRFPAVDG